MKPKVVVLSGAGISAESGMPTFRDADGLWEGHDVYEVASIEGWETNPQLILEFYNQRRQQARNIVPNAGHLALVKLEEHFDVTIITQNVDDLHEQAGSKNIIHMHGELFKSQSTVNPDLIYPIVGDGIKWGDMCELGSQLRPYIVCFGEKVPFFQKAIEATLLADFFIVVGTSLNVYPAAELLDYIQGDIPIYVVDKRIPYIEDRENLILVEEKATTGLVKVCDDILSTI